MQKSNLKEPVEERNGEVLFSKWLVHHIIGELYERGELYVLPVRSCIIFWSQDFGQALAHTDLGKHT